MSGRLLGRTDTTTHPMWTASQIKQSVERESSWRGQATSSWNKPSNSDWTTNNQAEYEALLAGLNLTYDMGAREVTCKSDSQVMVGQVNGEFEVKEPMLQRYYHATKNNIARFSKAPLEHIPREDNKRADILSKLSVTKKKSHQRSVIQIWLRHPSVTEAEVECLAIEEVEAEADNWMTPVIPYLTAGTCKADQEKAMKQQCARYTMINEDLYQRGYLTPLLKCITNKRAEYIMAEIHEGICRNHAGGEDDGRQGLKGRLLLADHTGRLCRIREEMRQVPRVRPPPPHQAGRAAQHHLSMGKGRLSSSWWELTTSPSGLRPNPLSPSRQKTCKTSYGRALSVDSASRTDNGRQFIDRGLQSFYDDLGIKSITTSVEHLQTNGQAEAANKVILNELKKWLGKAKGRWIEELIEETPYNLTYGTETMIPVEVVEPTIRRQMFDLNLNGESLAVNLDLVSEFRDQSRMQEATCKIRASRRYNTRVRPRSFQKGDLVWRMRSDARKNEWKFSSNWEGPFRVREVAQGGAYHLE
ncbi:uncharacterized protein [Phaseolus vulgaris]|uniref:uncharacterized protein n=1 Tax=Phaseolus vulgaris TaxID=3885 RepID=UPI0035C9A641